MIEGSSPSTGTILFLIIMNVDSWINGVHYDYHQGRKSLKQAYFV